MPRTVMPFSILTLLAACNAGTTKTIFDTRTVTDTVPVNHTIISTVVDDDLDGGRFQAPLVQLVELIGTGGAMPPGASAGQTHMHTSEMMFRAGTPGTRPDELFDCSYTFSVYNVDNPARNATLAQAWTHTHVDIDVNGDAVITAGVDIKHSGTRKPGCTHLTLDEADPEFVYTSHHGNNSDGDSFLSGWDLNTTVTIDGTGNPSYKLAPVQMPMFYEAGTAFEGMDYEDGLVYAAIHADGIGVYQRDPLTNLMSRVGGFVGTIENAFDVLVIGDTAYVADAEAGLVILDVSDPGAITQLGAVSFPGTAYDLAIKGDILYVAAESGGIVMVNVANPAAPVVANTINGSGTALAVVVEGDRLYYGGWTDARVYDITSATNPQIIGAVRREVDKDYGDDEGIRPDINNRVLTVTGHGDYLFNGTWWTPFNYQIHATRKAPYIVLPETIQQLTFAGDLEVGQSATQDITVRNDGNELLTVTDIWADGAAFSVEPSQLAIPPGGSATVSVTFSPTIGMNVVDPEEAQEVSTLYVVSDDPTQPTRLGYLVGNASGLGVGDPFPETTALLPDGSTWSYMDDAFGSVTLIAYWATFCPVCAHELPDMQTAFHEIYGPQGLQVIGLDADNAEQLNPQEVWDYIDYMALDFPMGLETTGAVAPFVDTYDTLEAVYDGGNPFPVDILVDKSGIIRYVSREYDPDGIMAALPDIMAE